MTIRRGSAGAVGASLALWLALALGAAPARADGTVILVDGSVAQYKETAAAVKARVRGELAVIDVGKSSDPIAEALARSPRVIVAVGQKALTLAAGEISDVPIVYCTVLYAEKHGLSGKNITGVPLEVPVATQLERFKSVAPRVKRIGVIHSKETGALVAEAQDAAKKLGLKIVAKSVGASSEVGAALDEIADRIDALLLLPDTKVISKDLFAYLLRTTLDRGLPVFGFLEGFTQAGALASVSPDYADIGARTADLVNQVLASSAGAPLPPKSYSAGALSINLKTAQRLGIDVAEKVVKGAAKVYK